MSFAVVPVEDVGAGLAGDRVVPGASRDVGDGHQGVRTGGRRRRRARARPAHGAEHDDDILGERGVVDAVGAEVAVNEVVAGVAVEDVVAGAAGQDVRTRVAAEDVGSAAARQVLEIGDLVGAGAAGGLRRRISQRERHASGHAGVVEQVDVAPARDRVVSGAFEDHVVSVVAEDEVVAGSAGLAIVAEASAQGVVAAGAVEDVVASAAGQVVGASASDHDVVAGAAHSVLDVGADVVRLPGLAVVEDTVERDEDACGARAVGHRVVSAAAGHRVCAVGVGPLVEDVVPEAARERVPAVLTGEAVVALAARDRVVARAAGENVAAGAAGDRVVALAARDRVVAAVAAHREEQRGGAARDRIARARERVGAVAPRHRAELDVRQRDVDVVVAVEVQPGGAERDDVAGRREPVTVTRSRTPVERSTTNSISERPEPSTDTPGANWPPLRSMVTFSAPVEPLTTIVSVEERGRSAARGHADHDAAGVRARADRDRAESPAALMLTVAVPAAKPHVTAAPARSGQSEGRRGERRADNCDQTHHEPSRSGSAPPADSLSANRRGRLTSSPPQLGQTALMASVQAGQKVHS